MNLYIKKAFHFRRNGKEGLMDEFGHPLTEVKFDKIGNFFRSER